MSTPGQRETPAEGPPRSQGSQSSKADVDGGATLDSSLATQGKAQEGPQHSNLEDGGQVATSRAAAEPDKGLGCPEDTAEAEPGKEESTCNETRGRLGLRAPLLGPATPWANLISQHPQVCVRLNLLSSCALQFL